MSERKSQLCIIDYLSFTWCPAEIEPLRRVAQSGRFVDPSSEEARPVKTMAQFIKYRESIGEPLDLHRLEYAALDELKTFFWTVGKDIFANCEYSTRDLWEDHFQLIERAGGVFGYRRAFDLVLDGHVIGLAASGGSQASCYVSISGRGCRLLAMDRVYSTLRALPLVKLTRVDIALDDFHRVAGGVEATEQAYIDGHFVTRGKPPECGWIASGGRAVDGAIQYDGGRTFTVGGRSSGKFLRNYEKGKQQGDPASEWDRYEVELRSTNLEIPLFVLIEPDRYFCGFYPYLAEVYELVFKAEPVAEVIPTRQRAREAVKKTAVAQYQASVENLKRVGGGVINVMRKSAGLSDSQIIDALIRDAVPRSLNRVAVPGLIQ